MLFAPLDGCGGDLPSWDGSQWRMAATPSDGATHVSRLARIVVKLERFPVANTVTAASVQLQSGSLHADLELRLQPVRSELWIAPRAALEPNTRYELSIAGLSDLDGSTQPSAYRVHFTTGDQLGEAPSEPTVAVSGALALFAAHCGSGQCHGGDSPALGLDLSDASAIEATAKNHAASEAYEPDPNMPNSLGTFYVAAPLIIEASGQHGDPARSYLIFKLLGDPHIAGDPMPPPGEQPLAQADQQLISDWIYAGASTL